MKANWTFALKMHPKMSSQSELVPRRPNWKWFDSAFAKVVKKSTKWFNREITRHDEFLLLLVDNHGVRFGCIPRLSVKFAIPKARYCCKAKLFKLNWRISRNHTGSPSPWLRSVQEIRSRLWQFCCTNIVPFFGLFASQHCRAQWLVLASKQAFSF